MLTKLLPDQVAKFWPIIKYAVEESLPPIVGEHPDKMNRILSAALRGDLDVWASYDREYNKFEAILITQFLYDDASNTKNLLLYCLYGYESINPSSWTDGFEALTKYAKEKKCNSMIAYTANPKVVELAKSYGLDTMYTFLSISLNKIV